MINDLFGKKFPFASKYFSALLEMKKEGKRNFPQGLIFEGEDTLGQYVFAHELARILNCKNEGSTDCNCTNCKWIRNFEHPFVIDVSQLHFKGEDDETKTVISVKQAREIEKSLIMSSDYHRFFIFFSSSKLKEEKDILKDYSVLNYKTVLNYTIEPLSLKTFHQATPNAMLKSLEEPPENTTFVFLTNSKENILPTIVSRCQVFKLSGIHPKIDYKEISKIFSSYPDINYENALEISDLLSDITKNSDKTVLDIIDEILEFLKDLMINNINNSFLYSKILNDVETLKKAAAMSKANIQDKTVFEVMMLKTVNKGG